MPVSHRMLRNSLGLLLLLCWLPLPVRAQTAAEANADLVRKIVGVTGARKPIRLSVRNLSSMPAVDFGGLRRALDAELASRGTPQSASAQDAAEVNVTLSENVRGFLWVAQIRATREEKEEVVMTAFDQPKTSSIAQPAELLRIEKKLVFEQQAPILDVAVDDVPGGRASQILVLEPTRLVAYRWTDERWQVNKTFEIPQTAPLPRDPRGRIDADRGGFTLYLPGKECRGTMLEEQPLSCDERAEEWALHDGDDIVFARFEPTRNFFVGPLFPGTNKERPVSPFYSLVSYEEGRVREVLVSSLDGLVRVYYQLRQPEATIVGWGSDLAAVESGCGPGAQVLATRAKDWTEADAVQAWQLNDDDAAVAVSMPAELSGPVTALWSSAKGDYAVAVVRNLKTGRYEAYTLKIACSR